MDQYLSYEDTLRGLSLSRDELNDLVARGDLRAFHKGDEVRFRIEDVAALYGKARDSLSRFIKPSPIPGQSVRERKTAKRQRCGQETIENTSAVRRDRGEYDLPCIADMTKYINKYVIGQERAVSILAVAAYSHFLTYRLVDTDEANDHCPERVLLLGGTGSGKSYMVRTLAKMLGVPFVDVSAKRYSETGYKGQDVSDIVKDLLEKCDWDPKRAEQGIIFIDEIDKIRAANDDHCRDVSGVGVQNALLDLFDGKAPIGIQRGQGGPFVEVNTAKIMIVSAGAFEDIEKELCRKAGRERGFAGFENDDLKDYGMIPELVGRFTAIETLDPQTEENLYRILTESKDSALTKRVAHYRLHGIELVFTDEALREVAKKAYARNVGARGLQQLIIRIPIPYATDLEDSGESQVIVTGATVREGRPPETTRGLQRHSRSTELRRDALRPAGLSQQPKRSEQPVDYETLKKQVGFYEASRAAQNLWTNLEEARPEDAKLWAIELKKSGVTVNRLHKGTFEIRSMDIGAVLRHIESQRQSAA